MRTKSFTYSLKIVEWFIFAVLLIVLAVLLSPLLPTKQYLYTYVVASGSMEPTIKTGSIAFIRPIKPEKVKKGDIVTFLSPKNNSVTILHRISGTTQKNGQAFFLTKGDHNNAADPWLVPTFTVKGEYIGSIPLIGYPISFARTKLGFILMVGVPALIMILFQIKKIRDGIEEEVQKRLSKQSKTMIMLYLVFSFGLTYAMHSMTVYALFSDKVTYRWASISAKAQIDCKNDHDDDEDDIDQCTKKPKQPKLIANLHDQNKLLNFKVQHISQFVTLQYQIVYDTDHGHQGISGNVELHTDKKYEKKDIVLGTCSSGVCIYHKDVHDVVIRVTLTDANGESTKLQLVLEKRHEHDEDDGF